MRLVPPVRNPENTATGGAGTHPTPPRPFKFALGGTDRSSSMSPPPDLVPVSISPHLQLHPTLPPALPGCSHHFTHRVFPARAGIRSKIWVLWVVQEGMWLRALGCGLGQFRQGWVAPQEPSRCRGPCWLGSPRSADQPGPWRRGFGRRTRRWGWGGDHPGLPAQLPSSSAPGNELSRCRSRTGGSRLSLLVVSSQSGYRARPSSGAVPLRLSN